MRTGHSPVRALAGRGNPYQKAEYGIQRYPLRYDVDGYAGADTVVPAGLDPTEGKQKLSGKVQLTTRKIRVDSSYLPSATFDMALDGRDPRDFSVKGTLSAGKISGRYSIGAAGTVSVCAVRHAGRNRICGHFRR